MAPVEPKKKAPAKKKTPARPKKQRGPFARLTSFLVDETAHAIGDPVPAKSEAAIRDVASEDPEVAAFVGALLDGNTSFSVFDLEIYPGMLLRGKSGEKWNESGAVVGDDELCLARNGGGDLYVWSATTGEVRFVLHDEGFRVSRRHANTDDFVEHAMDQVIEGCDADGLEDADPRYLACLGLALRIGDADSLDDEAREKLVELDVLSA